MIAWLIAEVSLGMLWLSIYIHHTRQPVEFSSLIPEISVLLSGKMSDKQGKVLSLLDDIAGVIQTPHGAKILSK